jgi:dienelactone hydrolase
MVRLTTGAAAHRSRARAAVLRYRSHYLGALALAALMLPAIARAATVEEVVTAPVALRTIFGPHRQDLVVTVFHDDRRQQSPYVVLNHGRTSEAAERAAMGRTRYSEISRYLVTLGFAVIVPTRIGYGVTAGPDVESSGQSCRDKNYAPGFDAAADEVAAALQRARMLPYVDLSHGIVAGTSFGGMTSIKLTTSNLPGLTGAVNFSGGVGGSPTRRPQNPCAPERLNQLYRSYGAAAKVPSIWLYSPNDLYWGPALPHQWFHSFVSAGGAARFVQLPPYGDNGHKIFTGNPPAWKPAFEQFLHELGFTGGAPQGG